MGLQPPFIISVGILLHLMSVGWLEDFCNMNYGRKYQSYSYLFDSKIFGASYMSNYRPISLCSVAYKLISKIMCQRLQQCLAGIISKSQASFVLQISDNILVPHELVSALYSKIDCSYQYVAVKTDISKAYDHVELFFWKLQ